MLTYFASFTSECAKVETSSRLAAHLALLVHICNRIDKIFEIVKKFKYFFLFLGFVFFYCQPLIVQLECRDVTKIDGME